MGVRHYPDTPRAYCDLDGVLADMEAGAQAVRMPLREFKLQPGAYLHLPKIEGATHAIATLEQRGYQIFVLSKIPTENLGAATEKLVWIKHNFPQLNDRVIITPDKGAVGRKCDFLIDDHPEWANAERFPGCLIHFRNNWGEVLRQMPPVK